MKEVYEEAHSHEAPTWKQVEDILDAQEKDSNAPANDGSDVVNFQRKIIPLDALNLALEELREKRLRNSAARKKQELIVCAVLGTCSVKCRKDWFRRRDDTALSTSTKRMRASMSE